MFARFTRLPLRRCLHTQATRPQAARFTRAALGVSAVTATYLTWRLLSDPIALDSHTTTSSLQKPNVSSKPPSKTSVASPLSDSKPETSSIPDSEPSPERPSSPTSPIQEPEKSSKKPNESGEQHDEAEEGSSQGGGAFNPETGEINWDCPCLGGMAHGPCGPEFREAFSCFVFSEQEPKGIDCVEKFKAMQDCFRRHPEVYSDEIMDDDEEAEAAAGADTPETAPVAAEANEATSSTAESTSISQETHKPPTTAS